MSAKHTRPLFAFDWDDVVADRDTARQMVMDVFLLAGVPKETILLAQQRTAARGYNFRVQMHEIIRLCPHLIGAAPTLYRTLEEGLARIGHNVYPDAHRFMEKLFGRYHMAVITAGNPEFQQQKMRQSGLARYFDHMLFIPQHNYETSRDKSRALGQLLELYPKIFFFEDQADTVRRVHDEHDKHGRIVPIRVDRDLETTIKYPNIIRHFDEFDLDRWIGSGA